MSLSLATAVNQVPGKHIYSCTSILSGIRTLRIPQGTQKPPSPLLSLYPIIDHFRDCPVSPFPDQISYLEWRSVPESPAESNSLSGSVQQLVAGPVFAGDLLGLEPPPLLSPLPRLGILRQGVWQQHQVCLTFIRPLGGYFACSSLAPLIPRT